jgi:asparagine synthase (glutamine-hydrolysing)
VEPNAIKELPNIVFALDEPILNISSIPIYFMAREASKYVRVVLTGNGADELFGGYMQHRFMNATLSNKYFLKIFHPLIKLVNKVYPTRKTIFLDKFVSSLDNGAKAYKLLKYPEPNLSLFKEEYKYLVKEDSSIEFLLSFPFSLFNNLTLMELKKSLPENYLMVDDKINRSFSIESRAPFLDNVMVDLSEKLPVRFKANTFKGKLIVRKAMKNFLPKKIISRKKYGFTSPATLWFNENFGVIKKEILKGEGLYKFIKKEEVEKLLNRRKTEDINRLWNLLILNLWIRQYIENEKIGDMFN